jgi:predicted metal-binding membrane protein
MWAEMMVAMMIPSAAPTILVFARVNRQRREHDRPYVHSGWFLLGYLSIWFGFSLAAAAAQWALHGAALLSPAMQSTSPILGGAVLIAAGIFQWTPWKRACLRHCRSPLDFLLGHWREGGVGAFRMGLEHGFYCTGCCWLLMAVLFVVGVMNILWIALLTGLVLLETVLPARTRARVAVGLALCVWGAAVMSK